MPPVLPRTPDLPLSGYGRQGQPEPGLSTSREIGEHVQEWPGVQQPPGGGPGEDSSEAGEGFM